MTCTGCSGAIERVLTKMQSSGQIQSFDVNLDKQSVVVNPSGADFEEVKAKIAKTGKEILDAKNNA